MTYYLKYRSKTIDELDLEEVRESLSNIVKSGQIPHAFLFSGPKGSGKTSAARIIAKIVNCENLDAKTGNPCNKCSNCQSITKGDSLDIIEIDAASHRGIDDIRTLRDAVKLAPASAKKKVYIIDEAHMLTTEASNALLKTLEEPPEHVIFILATTNPEKLIDTIRSRTVNINFKKASDNEIVRALQRVVKNEKLKINDDTLYVIASASGGSFRDAVKLLEELVIGKIKHDKNAVEEYLFKRKGFDVNSFLKILSEGDEKSAYSEIEKAVEVGVSIKNITVSVLDRLRQMLLAKVGVSNEEDDDTFAKQELLELISLISRSYSEVGYAVIEQIPLELAISEWFAKNFKDRNNISEGNDNLSDKKNVKKIDSNGTTKSNGKKKLNGNSNSVKSICSLEGFGDDVWSQILTEIKPKNASTEALLRAAKPVEYDGKTLRLGVYYKFHKEKLETSPHRNLLEGVLKNVIGNGVKVICTLTEPPKKNVKKNGDYSAKAEEIIVTESEAVLTEGDDEEIVKIAKEIFGN